MRTHSHKKTMMLIVAFLAVFAVVAGVAPIAVAAPGEYSDLVFIYRDARGVPIFPEWENLEVPLDCVQPSSDVLPEVTDLTYDSLVTYVDDFDVWLLPLWGSAVESGLVVTIDDESVVVTEEYLEELGVEACDVISRPGADYAAFMEEVPLSRLNLGRAPDRVLRQQYAEVSVMLAGASVISLDAAGRLTADDVAIDSSPMNQSVFRELLVHGVLENKDKAGSGSGEFFELPMEFMQIGAMALGVAADKTTPISIDTVAYMNRIYGIPGVTELDRVISEVEGTDEEFFDFGGFTYDRSAIYNGCFEGYVYVDGVPELTSGYFMTPSDPESEQVGYVFGGSASAEDIKGFARMADDARRVNLFMHDNAMLRWDIAGTDTLCEELFPADPEPDVTLPSVVVSSPLNNAVVGVPVSVSGTADDNVGVDAVRLEIYDRVTTMWWDGDEWSSVRTSFLASGTDVWSFSFDPVAPSAEPYWMTVQAFDAAGNGSLRQFVNFTVGGSP